MRILIADLFSVSHIENLKSQGFEILYDDKLIDESLQSALSFFDPQILVVRSTKVLANHFQAAKSLEVVIRAGTGYDNIDKTSANFRGIFIANCPGKNSVAVAELAFGLIISIDRRIIFNDKDLKQNKWNKGEYSNSKGLKGQTLGIIGYGNIGQEMAVRALAFEMNVLVYSRTKPNSHESRIKIAQNQDELLAMSDIITLHCPSTPYTEYMVNEEFLLKMKKNAVLINTSRGSLVVEKDLIKHLEANPEFWCGLDVFVNEPADKKGNFANKLALHPRVIGTHHIGASTKQAEEAIGEETYRMILEFRRTGTLPNCINMAKELNSTTLSVKYHNTNIFFEGLFSLLSKQKIRIYEFKSDIFEGGMTGFAKLKLEEINEIKSVDDALKELRDIICFKWE